MTNLDAVSLGACPYLAILHVKSSDDSPDYNHFVLFLGARHGRATIYDAPNPVREVALSELAPLWDGTAVVVSKAPVSLARLQMAELRSLAIWMVVGVLAVVTVRSVGRRLHYTRRTNP